MGIFSFGKPKDEVLENKIQKIKPRNRIKEKEFR